MPGERLRSYDSADVTGTLPAEFETVLHAAAAVVHVDIAEAMRVVRLFEGRLEKVRSGRTLVRKGSRGRLRSRTSSGRGRERISLG